MITRKETTLPVVIAEENDDDYPVQADDEAGSHGGNSKKRNRTFSTAKRDPGCLISGPFAICSPKVGKKTEVKRDSS